jgi:Tetratricopeptide repeat
VTSTDGQPSPRAIRLRQLDRRLEQDSEAIEPRFERASLLRESGRIEEAKRDYLELLRRAPTHFGALNDFGTMLLTAGYRDAARTVLEQAVRYHPDQPSGRVNLANLLLALGELAPARGHFEAALRLDPDNVHVHRGVGNLLAELGDGTAARAHRDRGFKDHFLTTLPYHGDGAGISVLLLVSALGGNIPASALLDDRIFRTSVLVTEYADSGGALPAHDLVFNSIGDADLCADGLAAACAIVARTTRPVINHPAAVRETGRLANAERLRGLSDVVMPRMASLPRDVLASPQAPDMLAARGFGFPLLLRAPGFHTGRHFVRVESIDDLASAVGALPGEDVWVIAPLDASGKDGKFHKYRVMIVGGQIYPLHLAISRHWKVHYFTAEMADSAEHRAQDAAFLDDMPAVISPRGLAALERIRTALALDYGGIDFAVAPTDEILFFEANATMVVSPPTNDPKWAYRRPAVERIIAAVRDMLIEKAQVCSATIVDRP